MFDALHIGATGMHAQKLNVDTIANNLANVSTTAYKKARVSFSELVVTGALRQGADAGPLNAAGVGAGVGALTTSKLFDAGDIRKTDSALDLAIHGDGFLELSVADGTRAYARGGSLKVNADGQLATQAGIPLKPAIMIPDNAEAILIGANGQVQARIPGQAALVDVGQIEMVRFTNPQGLVALGGNTYRATESSGEPIGGRPGEDGMGSIAQGFLEGSNVKMVEEMVSLMAAQRAYEASVKVVQASDEMLGLINGLRR